MCNRRFMVNSGILISHVSINPMVVEFYPFFCIRCKGDYGMILAYNPCARGPVIIQHRLIESSLLLPLEKNFLSITFVSGGPPKFVLSFEPLSNVIAIQDIEWKSPKISLKLAKNIVDQVLRDLFSDPFSEISHNQADFIWELEQFSKTFTDENSVAFKCAEWYWVIKNKIKIPNCPRCHIKIKEYDPTLDPFCIYCKSKNVTVSALDDEGRVLKTVRYPLASKGEMFFLPPFGVGGGVKFGAKVGDRLLERLGLLFASKLDDFAVWFGVKSERQALQTFFNRYGYEVSEHAIEKIIERDITKGSIIKVLQTGKSYFDKQTGHLVRVGFDNIGIVVTKSDKGMVILTTLTPQIRGNVLIKEDGFL